MSFTKRSSSSLSSVCLRSSQGVWKSFYEIEVSAAEVARAEAACDDLGVDEGDQWIPFWLQSFSELVSRSSGRLMLTSIFRGLSRTS